MGSTNYKRKLILMFQAIRKHNSRPETTLKSFIFVRIDKVSRSLQVSGIKKQSSAIKPQRLFFIFSA